MRYFMLLALLVSINLLTEPNQLYERILNSHIVYVSNQRMQEEMREEVEFPPPPNNRPVLLNRRYTGWIGGARRYQYPCQDPVCVAIACVGVTGFMLLSCIGLLGQ